MKTNAYAVRVFLEALGDYKSALESGDTHRIVFESLNMMRLKGTVPRRFQRLVSRTFRQTNCKAH